ncbi:hypothetical protein FJTKL_07636 [Diaporthe vaccinii]|uniref:Bromo domain-containing protein n=1 Tax=Diaporthe vaccinii TaxID=105482 RepID=A0ABR4ET33_9PEZI
MSANKGQGNTPISPEDIKPNWEEDKEWGPKFEDHFDLLDKLWTFTHWGTQEQRDEHLKVVKEEVIPLLNRCLAVLPSEEDEAFALFHKYHKPGGVRDTLLKEYDTLVKDMESRMPQMARAIKFSRKAPIIDNHQAICLLRPNEPFVFFNNATYKGQREVEIKTYQATRDLLLKKVALMKDQNDAMARALEKNGIQLPHECVAIQEQLHALKHFNPDQQSLGNAGELRLVSLCQDSSGTGFTGNWEKAAKPPVIEAEKTPAREMTKAELEDLLKALHRFKCGRFFETPLTRQQYDGYFKVVKQPRDLVTIKDSLSQDPQYGSREFFNDMRLMIDNYIGFFGEASFECDMAVRIEQEMLKKLEGYGEAGRTAKVCELLAAGLRNPGVAFNSTNTLSQTQFDEAPKPEFNELAPPELVENNPPPEFDETNPPLEADETFSPSEADAQADSFDNEEDFETSFAQGIRDNYEEDYGEGHDNSYFGRNEDVFDFGDETGLQPKTPSTVGPAHKLGSRVDYADQSPSSQGPAEQSEGEDDLVNRAWGAFDFAKGYDQAHGHATQAPPRHNTVQPHDDEDDRNSPTPGPSGPSGPAEQPGGNDSDVLSLITSPVPSRTTQLEAAAARQSGDEEAHAGAHALEQPAPVAPMYAEQEVVDLNSSPQRPTGHVDSASTKRARASDDQDSSSDDDAPLIKRRKTAAEPASDDDAPLIKPRSTTAEPASIKRQEMAADSSRYAVTSSLGKRSRDDDDDDGGDEEEEREQPAKRNKVSSPSAPEPLAPVAAAAGDGGPDDTSLTIDDLFEPFESPPRPVQEPAPPMAAAPVGEPSLETIQNLLRRVRNAQVPPSPIPEPITPAIAAADGHGSVSPPPMLDRRQTPEPANDAPDTEGHESSQSSSSPSAAADEPQPDPATEDLGHTDNGTITVSKLHRLPKYKRKGRSKASGRPNRPWVFGYWFDNEYGLYIMSCPEKGCEMGTEIFTTHPLMRNDAADHLQECGHDFNDDDDMVRKYGTQVISDDKKVVSIEWARKWNNELMKEYGDEDREEENF